MDLEFLATDGGAIVRGDHDPVLRIFSYESSHLASIHRNWYPPHKFVQRLHVGSVHGLRGIVMPLTRNGSAVPGDRCSTIHSFGNVAPRSGSEAISSVYTYNVIGSQIFSRRL